MPDNQLSWIHAMTLSKSTVGPVGLTLGVLLPLCAGLFSSVEAQTMQNITRPQPSSSDAPNLVPGSMPSPNATLPFQTVESQNRSGTAAAPATYRIGIGDIVRLTVFGAEDFGGEYVVLQDGTINLPRVGQVFVLGSTMPEAERTISAHYSRFLRQPMITLAPVRLQPVRVAVSGAVRRPGAYTVQQSQANDDVNSAFDSRFPTLTEAIAQAGGVTAKANIREVILRRTVSSNQKQATTYNLWELIRSGDLSKDVILQSGDEIFIPVAEALTPQEASDLAAANFAPDTVNIYVTGEVEEPGQIQVPLNTSLNEVLLNAGGFNQRANRGRVTLVRLAPDGTALQQEIHVDFTQDINESNNPILQDRDVVVVERSGIARFGDNTNIILNPFTQILNSIFGFRNLFD